MWGKGDARGGFFQLAEEAQTKARIRKKIQYADLLTSLDPPPCPRRADLFRQGNFSRREEECTPFCWLKGIPQAGRSDAVR